MNSPEPNQATNGDSRPDDARGLLIDAARSLFIGQTVEGTTAAQIADAARVDFNSFYSHFDSKEELAALVLKETIAAQGVALAEEAQGIEDPAEVVSIAHRHFVRGALQDPNWAWLLVRLDLSFQVTKAALGEHARADLERGIENGRFEIADPFTTYIASGGALLAVMHTVLIGELGEGADSIHAELMLRMMGLGLDDAAEVARRPFPPRESLK